MFCLDQVERFIINISRGFVCNPIESMMSMSSHHWCVAEVITAISLTIEARRFTRYIHISIYLYIYAFTGGIFYINLYLKLLQSAERINEKADVTP